MCYNKIQKRRFVLLIVLFLLLMPVVVYVFNFHNHELSNNSIDWGAFGSYFGGTISIVSVFLLYITYREQQRANAINHFEKRYYTQLETIRIKLKENAVDIKKQYDCIEAHFRENRPNHQLKRDDVLMACSYYFRDIQRQENYKVEVEEVLSYILHSIKMTSEHEMFSDELKHDYIQDLCPLLNKEIKTILLLFVVFKEKTSDFHLLKQYDCCNYLTDNVFLNEIIKTIMSSDDLKATLISSCSKIEFESYGKESVYNTIERLKDSKTNSD